MASDALVIVPTYNEKENITAFLDKVLGLAYPFEVLVVDDGSPDGTQDLVREVMHQNPRRVHLLPRSGKMGLGTAYIAGFEWGLQREYRYFFEIDADFSITRTTSFDCTRHAAKKTATWPWDHAMLRGLMW